MDFVAEKDQGIIPYILAQILDSCVNGVTLSDPDQPDNPIVYANRAFETITGYSPEEIIGRNCRFLQGTDRDQPAVARMRDAIANHQAIQVTLRNYRKNGELFYNNCSIQPLTDQRGHVIYYLGIQYDVTERVRRQEEITQLQLQLQACQHAQPTD